MNLNLGLRPCLGTRFSLKRGVGNGPSDSLEQIFCLGPVAPKGDAGLISAAVGPECEGKGVKTAGPLNKPHYPVRNRAVDQRGSFAVSLRRQGPCDPDQAPHGEVGDPGV